MSFAFFLIDKPIVEWLIDYTLCKEGFTGTCYLQAQGGRGGDALLEPWKP